MEALATIESELADQYQDAIQTVGFTDDERAVLAVGLAAARDAAGRLHTLH